MINRIVVVFTLFLIFGIGYAKSEESMPVQQINFEVFTANKKATILYDKGTAPLDSITAHLLAEDIYKVTNYRPQVATTIEATSGNVIVIGAVGSKLIQAFVSETTINKNFKEQWESYLYKTVLKPYKNIDKAFVIAGTNPRGTAFGVFNISKQIGVNPWYWWADVPVKKSKALVLNQPDFYSQSPSVKYRGIFLNDEDWGLQPWAAKNYETETGDIGPKTYAKIFELLLRLNANTIWPAMHPSTKAFFYYKQNPKVAELYNIVIGTSHAEPMLRNNVDEWDKESMGSFNYKTNKTKVYKYWEQRVKEAVNIDAIYSIGMRGVHDSGMEGVDSKSEAVSVLQNVISDQRKMLKTYNKQKLTEIPQALTVYKEVLDLYNSGLKVPEDISLVWTDDNYGYIRALSNAEEQKRSGGSGVYYHASYWGRPHDYLWLSSTHPGLIREEMMKAYNLNNKHIWILNVGDIKPAEYNTQLFLDMAYNADKFQNSDYLATHQQEFYGDIFGDAQGEKVSDIRSAYFQLAFERKPEFMGWSQTEPTTSIYNTAYNTLSYGDEISQRLLDYKALEQSVAALEPQIPAELKSVFTQLVSYPIEASANMNKKFLYRDKALTYNKQGRKSASTYKALAHEAYQNINDLTQNYNQLSQGKWNGIMDMKPRRLPVFDDPEISFVESDSKASIGVSVEDTLITKSGVKQLPKFYVNVPDSYFIDVYLKSAEKAKWKVKSIPKWLNINQKSGTLNHTTLEERLLVSINWEAWAKSGQPSSAEIEIKADDFKAPIQVHISKSYAKIPKQSFIEKNGLAVMYAEHFKTNTPSKQGSAWQQLKGFGHTKTVMQAGPLAKAPIINQNEAAVLAYELYTESVTKDAELSFVAIPTHPLTTNQELRIAVQWNDEPIEILDFKTVGRSAVWKENVLSNKAKQHLKVSLKTKGKQQLKIWCMDSGVLLDYMVLDTQASRKVPYKLMKETRSF